jgi:hypothetical protein
MLQGVRVTTAGNTKSGLLLNTGLCSVHGLGDALRLLTLTTLRAGLPVADSRVQLFDGLGKSSYCQ